MIATAETLFCWDLEKNTHFSASAPKTVIIKVLDCKNTKAAISCFADSEAIFVVVVLKSGEIRLYNLYLKLQKLELNKVLLSDEQNITSLATLKKNGRVFYGGATGNVNELKF